jgi:hypothetical protein
MLEIIVCREHRQIVPNAKLGEESINRSDLYSRAPTAISQIRGLNVIVAIRDEQAYGGKPVQNFDPGFRTREALQDLLEDKACGNHCLACFDGPFQPLDFRHPGWRNAPKRERPDTGINEEAQSRRRSVL